MIYIVALYSFLALVAFAMHKHETRALDRIRSKVKTNSEFKPN